MSTWPNAGDPVRRAPRLAPQETIGKLMNRTGRFARIDPDRAGTWPSWPKVVGVGVWAAFTGTCAFVAWRRHRD